MTTVTENASEPNVAPVLVPQSSIAVRHTPTSTLKGPNFMDPFAVLRCAEGGIETFGAFGVTTFVVVGGLTGEGATAGTSTIVVVDGAAMYVGSGGVAALAAHECSEAF